MRKRPRLRLTILPPWWVVPYYGLLLAALYGFAELADDIYETEGFAFDEPILTWLYAQQTPWLTGVAHVLDVLGVSYLLGALSLGLARWLWPQSRRSALFLLLAFWGAVGVNLFTKGYFERARPDLFEQLTPITNFSFPSGHAMGSWAFWLALTLVGAQRWPRWAALVSLLSFIFALAVGLSRAYLQVHYLSDVLAGWALSTAWVLGVGGWYTYGYHRLRAKQRRTGEPERVEPWEGVEP